MSLEAHSLKHKIKACINFTKPATAPCSSGTALIIHDDTARRYGIMGVPYHGDKITGIEAYSLHSEILIKVLRQIHGSPTLANAGISNDKNYKVAITSNACRNDSANVAEQDYTETKPAEQHMLIQIFLDGSSPAFSINCISILSFHFVTVDVLCIRIGDLFSSGIL